MRQLKRSLIVGALSLPILVAGSGAAFASTGSDSTGSAVNGTTTSTTTVNLADDRDWNDDDNGAVGDLVDDLFGDGYYDNSDDDSYGGYDNGGSDDLGGLLG